jgi:leucyl-tRNA---protein transferase
MPDFRMHAPKAVASAELDQYLARGWYRMGQNLFTCNYLQRAGAAHRAFWVRYAMPELNFSASQRKMRRMISQFTISTAPLRITSGLEELYAIYKTGIDFEASLSVRSNLMDRRGKNLFDTRLIRIQHGRKLIAAGIFDRGQETIAGIMNFYHPDYRRYSLGKCLMLLKMEYAIANRLQWYYPGYVALGMSKFEYKLDFDPAATQLFLPELNAWVGDAKMLYQSWSQPR